MVFPVVLRGRPGTSARNHPHETSTSKPVVPVLMCFQSSYGLRIWNRLRAGVGSGPTAARDRTLKVYRPTRSFPYVLGELHALKCALGRFPCLFRGLTSAHWKPVAP